MTACQDLRLDLVVVGMCEDRGCQHACTLPKVALHLMQSCSCLQKQLVALFDEISSKTSWLLGGAERLLCWVYGMQLCLI